MDPKKFKEILNDPESKTLIEKMLGKEKGILSPEMCKQLFEENGNYNNEFIKKLLSDDNGMDQEKLKKILGNSKATGK
jgi:DNA-dependent RNA polymerase auxiliary subunit epsilon